MSFRIVFLTTILFLLGACGEHQALNFIRDNASFEIDHPRCDGPLANARRSALAGNIDMRPINRELIEMKCLDEYSRITSLPSIQKQIDPSSAGSVPIEKRGDENVMSFSVGEVRYIRIQNFSHPRVIADAHAFLLARPFAKKFILDLRGNRGGLIYSALRIAELFAPYEGAPLVIQYEKNVATAYLTEIEGPLAHRPVVVLVDSYTASASEMDVGVLKYWYPEGVRIVGTQTFGKGVYQNQRRFRDSVDGPGVVVSVTAGWWYVGDASNYFSIDGRGFEPDFPFRDIKVRGNPLDDPAVIHAFALSGVGLAPGN